MEKFPQAREMLAGAGWLSGELAEEHKVGACPETILERVHDPAYLEAIRQGALNDREQRVLGLPPCAELLHRSACETEGTRRAAIAALETGLAVNLAGGTHHAFPDHGEGFCVLNDVAVAIRDLHDRDPHLRVFVLDTDAHQGNGTHAIFAEDPRVFTFSIHVARNYPSRKVPGDLDIGLDRFVTGEKYLAALREILPGAARRFAPDLVIWISGADPHQNDRFGQMLLTVSEMQERDRFVLRTIREDLEQPLAVLYGGGYNREPRHTARLHRNTVVATLRSWESTA